MQIRKTGILYHPAVQATSEKARELSSFLAVEGIETWECSAWDISQALKLLDTTDLLLTVGGDGTILRASQVAMKHQIPITGINMGNLGFLTELKVEEAEAGIKKLLQGEGWMDERIMLEVEVSGGKEQHSESRLFQALNDVVLARGDIVKMIQIDAIVDGKPLTTYRADGVILATATGSTSYAMAAGGPILYPQSSDMVLVPISTHLSMSYSLVLSGSSVIQLKVRSNYPATLNIDGHTNLSVGIESGIIIRRGTSKTRFLRLNPQTNFFHILEGKLRGINN